MTDQPEFFLKTAPLPGEPPSPYTELYLRHHGGGINSIVLTPGPPKFIKGHMEGERIIFTSASHPDRRWGVTLQTDGTKRAGWEKVEIVEDAGSDGLVFTTTTTDEGTTELLEFTEKEDDENVWTGWMACEWAHGHPQLFWLTHNLKKPLPSFCHRVQVTREMLGGV